MNLSRSLRTVSTSFFFVTSSFRPDNLCHWHVFHHGLMNHQLIIPGRYLLNASEAIGNRGYIYSSLSLWSIEAVRMMTVWWFYGNWRDSKLQMKVGLSLQTWNLVAKFCHLQAGLWQIVWQVRHYHIYITIIKSFWKFSSLRRILWKDLILSDFTSDMLLTVMWKDRDWHAEKCLTICYEKVTDFIVPIRNWRNASLNM